MTLITNFIYFLMGVLLGCLLAISIDQAYAEDPIVTDNIIENSEFSNCDNWSGDTTGNGGGTCSGAFVDGEDPTYQTGHAGGKITSDKMYFQDHLTIDDWQTGFDLDYGAKVWSHSSNLYVPLCSQTNWDCKDNFTIELTLGDGETIVETFTHNELQDYSGWRDFSYSQTVEENSFQDLWATLSLYGIDAGYPAGMYGPRFDDPFLNITYYEYIPPLPEEMDFLVDEIENMISEEIINDEFFDELVATVNTVGTSTMNFNVAISDEVGEEMANMEVSMEMDLEMDTIEIEIASSGEEEVVVVDIAEEVAEMEAEMESVEPEVMAANEAQPEPEEQESEEQEEESQEDTQKEDSPKEAVKTKVLAAIVSTIIAKVEAAGGDTEGAKIALMGMMGVGTQFASYQQAVIPDSILYNSPVPYISNNIDPLSSVYALGSDIMMNSMIDSQYNFKK